jgi:hypothetical protein
MTTFYEECNVFSSLREKINVNLDESHVFCHKGSPIHLLWDHIIINNYIKFKNNRSYVPFPLIMNNQ